jgi:hypothetical protein
MEQRTTLFSGIFALLACLVCKAVYLIGNLCYVVAFNANLLIWFAEILGNKVEKVCDLSSITLNKNAVFGDSSALSPGGVRIGQYLFPNMAMLLVLFFSCFGGC